MDPYKVPLIIPNKNNIPKTVKNLAFGVSNALLERIGRDIRMILPKKKQTYIFNLSENL
jgi:hypothetical protein